MKKNTKHASFSRASNAQGPSVLYIPKIKPQRLLKKTTAVLLSGLLAFQPMLLQAQQITPDTAAPVGNQPGVGAAPNGVPLVDIVTPNSQGLSHNKYHDFNVGTPGAILNNHNAEIGTSKLGGITPGNPNLRNSGPATVILNEVTSGNRSSLLGPTEVFGGRADVIIANPNGITCDGCGFINTPRATLTTGTPDIDGSGRLSGFTARGGDVTFGSKGGNFASGDGAVDLFDVVSRTIRVDGPVHGKSLRLTAGKQKFDYATGNATALDGDDAGEFAIDGSALGAMQADRIKIVVTDKGAGVRMRGDMAANAGELTFSVDGKISLGNASGRDGVNIQSKRSVEAKKVTSKKRVVVKADKGITLQSVAADEDIVLSNGEGLLSVAGDLASLTHIELTSAGTIAVANVAAGQNANLNAGQGITAEQVVADGSARLATSSGNVSVSKTVKAGKGDLTITASSGNIAAGSLVSFNNLSLQAGADIAIGGDILSGGSLVASARSIKAQNAVSGIDMAASAASQNGAIVLGTAGDLNLTANGGAISIVSLQTAGNLNASSASISAQSITGHGAVVLSGDTNVSGQVLAAKDVSINGSNIRAGAIVSGIDFAASQAAQNGAIILGNAGNVQLTATSGAINLGTLLSAGDFNAASATFNAGNVTSYGTATISGATTITGQLLSVGDVNVTGSSINANTIVAGVDGAALKQGNVVLSQTALALHLNATAGDLTTAKLLSSGNITGSATGNLSANATAHGDLTLNAGGKLTLTGQSLVGNNATLTANALNLGTVISGVDFAATEQSGGALILKTGNGALNLNATGGSITADQLLSGGNLNATAQQNIAYNSLQSFANADLNARTGTITLDHKTVAAGNITLTLQSLDLSNNRSQVATAGTLIVNAGSATLANSDLTFGGLTLNLTGSADLSNAKVRAVTGDGGSGNIAISGQTITTTASTALLAANDLTLTLASLTNNGQLASGRDLTFNIAGNFTNTSIGLVYAGQDGKFYVAGDLLNDQGAILTGRDLTIAANAQGGRTNLVKNISGLIQSGRDISIKTTNLENIRLVAPTMETVQLANDQIIKFDLNPETWGKPLGALFNDPETLLPFYPYPDDERAPVAWIYKLYGVVTLSDGTSYHTGSIADHVTGLDTPWMPAGTYSHVSSMMGLIKAYYPTDENGQVILTPDLQSKFVLLVNRNESLAGTLQWDDNTQMRSTIWEDRLTNTASASSILKAGGNLTIDTVNLLNSYSAIEAGENATITGSGTLTNEGFAAYRTTTTVCEAKGGCQAYDTNGNRDATKDLDYGGSGLTTRELIGGVYSTIQSAGNLSIRGFSNLQQLMDSAPGGTITGGASLANTSMPSDPTDILGGMTAGGALYTPNAALNAVSANGNPLMGTDLLAALGSTAPKPNSGGFGGTIPGQVFLYETRAEFLDVGKFYGSGYFINRIGYNPDHTIPFLGDAYFENQLIDQQLRALIGQGLGKGSFIPGSDAIEQMKTLLDQGADFANANGLAIGKKLSPELVASLMQSIVWYETKTVNGIEVLVPVVYVANADKANLTVAGSLITGGSVDIDVGNVQNTGTIAAKTDLKIAATNITATDGNFIAGNDLTLNASQNLTIASGTLTLGNDNFVLPGSGVTAGGNANLSAGNALTLRGADVKAGNDVSLDGKSVTLDTAKATNNGSDNVLSTSIQSGGNTSITAENDVNIIGSNVNAGKQLNIEAENGSVNIVAAEVDKKVTNSKTGQIETDATRVLQSNLSSGGDTSIKAGDDILISGPKVQAGGDVALEAKDDVTITVAEEHVSSKTESYVGESVTNIGSEIKSGGSVSIQAGTKADANNPHDINIIGSNIEAEKDIALSATDNITIAEAHDISHEETTTKSDRLFGSKETHTQTDSITSVVSTLKAGGDVSIVAGNDAVLIGTQIDSGGSALVGAGGDVILAAAQDVYQHSSSSSESGLLSSSTEEHSITDLTNKGVSINAGGDVNVISIGGDIVTAGTQFNAPKGDINLTAVTCDIYAGTYTDIHAESHYSQSSYLGGLFGSTESTNLVQEFQTGTGALAGVNLSLVSGDDTTLIGSQLSAGNNLNIITGDDLTILAAIDSERSETFSQDLGLITMTTITEQSFKETANLVSLIAGGQLSINVGGNTNLTVYNYEGQTQNLNELYPQEVLNQQGLKILHQLLANEYYYDKQTQLSPAFKAVLTVAVGTFVMPGLGLGNLLGLAADSWQLATVNAFTSSLIVNGVDAAVSGNFDLDDLLKQAAVAGLTAGLTSGIDIPFPKGSAALDNLFPGLGNGQLTFAGLLNDALDGAIRSGVNSAVYGGDFGDSFVKGLIQSTISSVSAAAINETGDIFGHNTFSVEKLLLKAIINCGAAAATDGSCASGAIGTLVTEAVVGISGSEDKEELRKQVQAVAAVVGWLTSGGDPDKVHATVDAAVNDYDNNILPLLILVAAVGLTAADYALTAYDAYQLSQLGLACDNGDRAACAELPGKMKEMGIEIIAGVTIGAFVPGDKVGMLIIKTLKKNGDKSVVDAVDDALAKYSGGAPQNSTTVSELPTGWKEVKGIGANINTPNGFKSYVTPDGTIVHVSPAGLVYGYDPKFGNRVDHVLAHTVPDPTKPTHTVFNVQGDDALKLIDEAWIKRVLPDPNDPKAYSVDMGRPVGTNGETRVRVVVDSVTNEITTAYPF